MPCRRVVRGWYRPLVARPMWIVTQVAPYRDGPAGVHGVLPQAATALGELASMAGLEPRSVGHVSEIDAESLVGGGVLALFTIGETPFDGRQRRAVVDGWRAGRLALLGVHAATDASHGWSEYGRLIGGRFAGHPWTCDMTIEITDPVHPSTRHLPRPWEWHDEVYLFEHLRPDAKVLLRVRSERLDMSAPGARTPACGFPLAWCIDEGGGTFYSALGHFPHAWEEPVYLRHLAGGLSWLLQRGGATGADAAEHRGEHRGEHQR